MRAVAGALVLVVVILFVIINSAQEDPKEYPEIRCFPCDGNGRR